MLCRCGCGMPTPLAAGTGEPLEFVHGHWARGRRTRIEPPNPSGICQCGCGRPAPIATLTNERSGHVAGEPMMFIRGHVGNLRRVSTLTPERWRVEDRGYETPCWIWLGHINKRTGYGRVMMSRRYVLPHRAMYEQEVGPIPEGLDLDHLCSQRSCVRPSHLEPVTRAENIRRSRAAKLTSADVSLIRESSLTNKRCAELFGVSPSLISRVRSGDVWKQSAVA